MTRQRSSVRSAARLAWLTFALAIAAPVFGAAGPPPYAHFLFRQQKGTQGDKVWTVATVTAEGVTLKDLTSSYLEPLGVQGGRFYGVAGDDAALVAVDLRRGRLSKVGREKGLRYPLWAEGHIYFSQGGEIREYDVAARAGRSLGKIPGRAVEPILRVSPDRRWLAFFVELSNNTNGPCQLWLIDLRRRALRPIGEPMRWQDMAAASMFHFTPFFAWMDARRLVILRASGEPPRPGPAPADRGSYVVSVVDAQEGTVRDVGTLPGTLTWSLAGLTRVTTWPQPVVSGGVWDRETRKTSTYAFMVDAAGTALVPAELTAGEFSLVVGTGPYAQGGRLSYRGTVLASSDQDLGATVSPDRRFAAWMGRDAHGEPVLYVFDTGNGKKHEVKVTVWPSIDPWHRPTPAILWFREAEAKR